MEESQEPDLSTIVRLDIGGMKFTTTIRTLIQRDPNSMLAAMFSGRHSVIKDPQKGSVFIERDGTHFRHVLNWLRDGVMPILDASGYQELLREAEYYQLLGFIEQINIYLNRKKEEDENKPEMTRKEVIKCIQSKQPKLRGINLSGLDLSKLDLSGVDFSHARLQNTFFSRANLQSAKFRDSEADGSNFHHANLRECVFVGASLRGALLAGANLQSANLQDASLDSCSFCEADLRSAHLQGADLTDANLSGANLEGANLKVLANTTYATGGVIYNQDQTSGKPTREIKVSNPTHQRVSFVANSEPRHKLTGMLSNKEAKVGKSSIS